MYQGETIKTIMSGFPCNVQNVSSLVVIFKQEGKQILSKSLSSCLIDTAAQQIVMQITEEESLRLQPGIVERSVVFKVGSERYEVKPDSFIVQQSALQQSLT